MESSSHLVQMCGKTEVMGCVRLVGGAFSIWFPSGAAPMGQGVSLIKQPEGSQNLPWVLFPGSHLGEIDSVHLLLAVMLMRMTHWGLPLLRVGSSASHGGGGCPMRWTGIWNIYHPQGQAYNVLSRGDWWLCPHFGPPSCTKGSGSSHWSGAVHLDHVCPSGP